MNDNYTLASAEETQPLKAKNVKQQIIKLLRRTKQVRYSTIREARKALHDFLVYLVFLALATFVTQTTCDYKMHFYTKLLQQELATKTTAIELGNMSVFSDIQNLEQFWDFIQFTFLPLLERGDFKQNDSASIYKCIHETKQFDEIFGNVYNRTIMHGNVLLGPPRLRQIRVQAGKCEYHPSFSKYSTECYTSYNWLTEEREEYKGYKWQSMSEVAATPLWGELEIYLGAGYVISFSYDNEVNMELVKRLKEETWLNQGTRVFLLEFSLYHVDTRLFESAKFMVEQPPTGGCVPQVKLRTLRRESFFSNSSWLMYLVTFAYYICIIFNTCREILLIKALRFCNYISVMINLIDFLLCLLSYLMLFLNIAHFVIMESVMRHVKQSDQYISLDLCWEINIIYNNIAGFIIFIAWIRLLHFVAFNRTMVIFVKLLHKSKKDIIGFLLIFFAVIMAYAQCGKTLFAGNDSQFRSLLNSILTMLRWTVGDSQFEKMSQFNQIVTWTYYISFVILVYMLLLFSLQAIVINTYDELRQIVMTHPSRLGTVISLGFRDIYDLLYLLVCGKRKTRASLDVDAMGEHESDPRIDPRQAAAMAAMRQMELNNPTLLTQSDYLPGRLERAGKRIKVLEELTVPALKRLLDYQNLLRKQHNMPEPPINAPEATNESDI